MNKLELINKKLELRAEAEKMLNAAKTEKRELNKDEDAKFDEIRKQMAEIDEQIKDIEKQLEDEKRNADEMKHINNKRNMAKYSILNAIRSKVNGSQMDEATALAVQIATEENRAAGLACDGIVIPAFETRDASTMVAKVDANGGYTVATDLQGLLTPLYDNQVLGQFTWMTGLRGNIDIPVMTGSNVGWADEIAEAEKTANTFSHVTLQPKRLTAYLNISKQLILQSNESIEAVVRQDIVNALNDKLQKTLLGDASVSATQPAGIFNGASDASMNFSALVAIEEDIEEANTVATGYIINPYVKATGRTTLKSANVAGYLFENGQLLGQPTAVTNASKGIVYGNLKDFVIGQWGNIELTVDPYTRAKNGEIQIVINAYFDAVKRRNGTIVAKKIAKA